MIPGEHSSRPGVNESEGTESRRPVAAPDDCAMQKIHIATRDEPPIYHPGGWYWEGVMLDLVDKPKAAIRVGDTEKVTINLGFVDLGHIDLLVSESVYANRSDFIRTAVRNQIARHGEVTRQSVARKGVELGLRRYDKAELEAARASGIRLDIRVLGLASIAPDVSPELARDAIASIEVMGSLQATPDVKAALADRLL